MEPVAKPLICGTCARSFRRPQDIARHKCNAVRAARTCCVWRSPPGGQHVSWSAPYGATWQWKKEGSSHRPGATLTRTAIWCSRCVGRAANGASLVLASVAASGAPLLPSASTSPPFYLALLRSYATVPVSARPVSCHAVLQCRVYPCKNCTALTAPFNGKVTGTGFTPGTGLFFACNAPYVLQGSVVRYCNVSGTWSGVPATCSIPDIPCKYHEFKCGGSGGCISTTKVCDGVWYDCPDGSD
ncbi:uncharacterized protein LOC135818439 isoform X2 [Sycon ciliatum]|uniref:uncharacterized protein LOC135818439 isoform X2 n=1 Tax=Sycon ciliatum TaxID=27933 RepID=UPI0031F6B752